MLNLIVTYSALTFQGDLNVVFWDTFTFQWGKYCTFHFIIVLHWPLQIDLYGKYTKPHAALLEMKWFHDIQSLALV